MYIVTGGAGFIGSNIINSLNNRGISNIIVVDNLSNANKFKNISLLNIEHYMDKNDFLSCICNKLLPWEHITAVFHQGACSDTMNNDGKYMMNNNYQYSLDLLDWCQDKKIPFIYASSAAVYGDFNQQYINASNFVEEANENPLNIYGYSKLLFDKIVRRRIKNNSSSQIVGLRYFNVYGKHEQHKGRMSSLVLQGFLQYIEKGYIELFGEYDNYDAGEQLRDFIFVDDVIKVNLFFLDNPNISGIFNVGTGNSYTFNQLAVSLINNIDKKAENEREINIQHKHTGDYSLGQLVSMGKIRYKSFPEYLINKYQSFTQADIRNLRKYYNKSFYGLDSGIKEYVKYLMKSI